MAIKRSHPVRFTPKGLADAYDATDTFPGACTVLTNLIFDQVNPEFVVDIPGTLVLADFVVGGFSSPGFISIQQAIGQRVYGMIATSRNANHDEPFCYDNSTNTFVTISNVLAGNTPTSPSTIGDWTPPTLAVVGTMVVITHPGFNGVGSNFYGVIDITNPAAPAWRSENTATFPLPSVPTCVANYFNRAYFACTNSLPFSDILTNPLTRTNANQVLVIGDTQNINALAGLPTQTTNSGVIGALTIFKQTQVWQVTGDASLFNLQLSFLSLTVGTQSPRSIQQCPAGMYFAASSGPYFLDLLGGVRELVNQPGQSRQPDIQIPFQNAVTPTRWASAYISPVYRVCGPTSIQGVQTVNDYWFDEHKRRWTGPHSFGYDCGSAIGDLWCLSSNVNPAKLIQSSPVPSASFPTTNLGMPIAFTLQSATFPKEGDMAVKQVSESQIELASPQSVTTFTITAQNESAGTVGGPIPITIGANVPRWGTMIWGTFVWTSAFAVLRPNTRPIYWTAPLIFEKMGLYISGVITGHLGIGTFYARYQPTGYMTTGIQ